MTTATTCYAGVYQLYADLGWSPIKLAAGTKFPPPTGFTGDKGVEPSYADMHAWAEEEPNGNIALRLADGFIGIDKDCWNGKTGQQTIAEAERLWGALPDSPASTSRSDGSGIRIYRVPPGCKFISELKFPDLNLGGVEILQRHHRYVMAWPSIHPNGNTYEWYDTDGNTTNPPHTDDIPDLPAKWVEALREADKPSSPRLGADGPYNVQQALTEGQPSPRVAAKLGEAIVDCAGGSRHDATRDNVLGLLRCGKQGEPGVLAALTALQKTFIEAVWKDREGGRGEAKTEYRKFVMSNKTAELLADNAYDFTNNITEVNPEFFGTAAADQTEPPPPFTFTDGGTFIFDQPDTIPAIWGTGTNVLWAEGESLMIAGPMGLGKTTLGGQLVRARLGLGDGYVLGLPVTDSGGTILYLAMDRPRQIARSLARQFHGDHDRQTAETRLKIWQGPPPSDIAQNPGLLLRLAQQAGADTVILDSVKDAALGLTNDEVGAGYNRARQHLIAAGIELLELHHTVKRGANGGAPTTAADVYGSAWIANGTGSIILLSGDPGDAIVGFKHIRQPADEVGPWQLHHNQTAGHITISASFNILEFVGDCGPHGATALALAEALDPEQQWHTDRERNNARAKARRQLDRLTADGKLHRVEGSKGGGADRIPTAYFLAAYNDEPITAHAKPQVEQLRAEAITEAITQQSRQLRDTPKPQVEQLRTQLRDTADQPITQPTVPVGDGGARGYSAKNKNTNDPTCIHCLKPVIGRQRDTNGKPAHYACQPNTERTTT